MLHRNVPRSLLQPISRTLIIMSVQMKEIMQENHM
jgi:hypothetical protein